MISRKTRKTATLLLALIGLNAILLLGAVGCSGPTEPEPAPDPVPTPRPVSSCEKNHTAIMDFYNASSRTVYDVILDGSRIGSIGPGRTISQTVSAGQHTFRFIYSNNGRNACSQGSPNMAQCSHHVFSCSSDL